MVQPGPLSHDFNLSLYLKMMLFMESQITPEKEMKFLYTLNRNVVA
jgi:hypothetical protein